MATVKDLIKKPPIAGGTHGKESVVDAWAARASRNSVQSTVNNPAQNNKMTLPDTNKPCPVYVRTYDQVKFGKG